MSGNVLTLRQSAFVAALAAGRCQAEAARVAGVGERQGRRWLKLPQVQAAIARVRDDMIERATNMAIAYSLDALAVLHDLALDADIVPSARVAASKAILDSEQRMVETNVLNVRVGKLETAMDMSQLTDAQLQRIAAGEDPSEVIGR